MVEVVQDGQIRAYADFDNRSLPRSPQRTALANLPVLDISPFLRESTPDERIHMARALRSACIDIGFFYLIGHGFTPSKLDAVLAQGRRFFELAVPEKLKLLSHNVDEPGYVRMGGVDPEKTRDKVVDIKERLSLSRDLMPGEQLSANSRMGKSQWPSRALLPDFEPTMKGYISSLQRIVGALNHAFALSLSLPEDHFDSDYGRPSTTLMLNYYPPVDPAKLEATQWSFSPHADYTAFTVLLQDDSGGLQARNSAGDWIDVPPIDGTFVVNVGNLLARWTNDLYCSTLHRALHIGNKPRISGAFFVYPDDRAMVRCLDTCQGPQNPPRYEPVITEEYVRVLREDSQRAGRPAVATDTAERLKSA
jgi:isopenicillin N synthase-like dioxygenase